MKRTRLLCLVAGALSVAVLGASCRSRLNGGPPISTPIPSVPPGPTRVSGTAPLRVVFDDPRLAAVRELERAKDWSGALRLLREVRAGATLTDAERCGWDFVEGRLAASASVPLEAAAAFARAESASCPLVDYARLRGSQSLARGGHADEAIAKARSVSPDVPVQDDVKMVVAESLSAKNDRAHALPLWRAWLASNPRGSRWVDTSVRIANAILDGEDGPPELHAQEAYDVVSRVVIEAPKLADSSGATAARSRAVVLLRRNSTSVTEALNDAERSRQAQAWLDAEEPSKAMDLASDLVVPGKSGAAACRAAIVRAQAGAKLKGPKVDAWSDAVVACERDEQLVVALYSGAKARAGKDLKQSLEWFARLEKLFPTHRLADDARLRSALLLRQSAEGDHERRAEEMLQTLPDAYPSGDMRTEALFQVALGRISRGDWQGAKPSLERITELAPDDKHWATAGRAEYFRARASAMAGDTDDAEERFGRIVERHPLSFYMLLAHARLAERNPSLADQVLKSAIAKDAAGSFPARPHPIFDSPGAIRAAALLEVGETEAARREFTALGVLADGSDSEAVWMVGALYNQAGLPELGHAFARGRLTDFLDHYPEGAWRTPWQVAYPRAFDALVTKTSADNAIPGSLAWAIMREESSFIADVRSHSNAIGLMQLIVPTAKWVASGTSLPSDEASLKRPDVSIGLGTRLLGKLRATHGHPALAIGAYNAGSGAVDRWVAARGGTDFDMFVELIPYEETRNYVKRVLSSQAAYAYLYEQGSLKEPLNLSFRVRR